MTDRSLAPPGAGAAIGLPALYPPEGLPDLLEHLLRHVCCYQDHQHARLRPVPEKCELFSHFPVRRVVKKSQVGKDKSVKGYVWVDTDPIAMLFNRYVVKSCHTLDNTQYPHRTGNFNYLYHPWIATVYAGPMHPAVSSSRIAKSPVTGYVPEFNNDGIRIRPHQASANIALMRDLKNQPYLLLCRLYDSAQEYPWAHSIVRYCVAHCKKLGLGLALGLQTWTEYPKSATEVAYPLGDPDKNLKLDYRELLTPPGVVPLEWDALRLAKPPDSSPSLLPGYGVSDSGDNQLRWSQNDAKSYYSGHGHPLVSPARGVLLESDSFPLLTGDDRLKRTIPKDFICNECAVAMDSSSVFRAMSSVLCVACYRRLYTTCCNCDVFIRRGQEHEHDDYHYCDDCFQRLFANCSACDSRLPTRQLRIVCAVTRSGLRTNTYVCKACLARCHRCQRCYDYYTAETIGTGGTMGGLAVNWVCRECVRFLDSPDLATEQLAAPAQPRLTPLRRQVRTLQDPVSVPLDWLFTGLDFAAAEPMSEEEAFNARQLADADQAERNAE